MTTYERTRGKALFAARYTAWLMAAGLFFLPSEIASQDSFKIIVNSANPVASLSKKEISDIFLRKTATWGDGQQAQPVDQVQTSAVRQAFSREVLGVGPEAANKQAVGEPPPSMATDRDVLAYVRLKPGAIGYVSSAAQVTGVKVVALGAGGAIARGGQQPLAVGDAVKAPAKVFDVRPVYPATAKATRTTGSVEVQIVIGPTGSIEEAHVVKSSHLFDDAALQAVRQWRYAPTMVNGAPVPVTMVVRVDFVL